MRIKVVLEQGLINLFELMLRYLPKTIILLSTLAAIAGICLGIYLGTGLLICMTLASIILHFGLTFIAGGVNGQFVVMFISMPSICGLICLWTTHLLVWLVR